MQIASARGSRYWLNRDQGKAVETINRYSIMAAIETNPPQTETRTHCPLCDTALDPQNPNECPKCDWVPGYRRRTYGGTQRDKASAERDKTWAERDKMTALELSHMRENINTLAQSANSLLVVASRHETRISRVESQLNS